MYKAFFLLSLFTGIFATAAHGNPPEASGQLIDKVLAIVDDKIILYSDIENQINLMVKELNDDEISRCYLMEQMIVNKILTSQAMRDSNIVVSDDEVNGELDRKINYYIGMLGSKERFEEYYNKPVEQIVEDFRDDVKDQMFAQRMRSKVLENLSVSPTEVRDFFNKIPQDSLPYYDTEFEVSQIVIKVKVSAEQQQAALDKILDIKKRVAEGEDFSLLATLYSEDPGSAAEGGELGLVPRGTFVPEFEAAAFKLANGEVSEVVKTMFGYHLIKMNERLGDQINVSHILIKPATSGKDAQLAKQKIDSISKAINDSTLTFFSAVKLYSDDEVSKNNGGSIINPETGSTVMEPNEMDPTLYKMIDELEVGKLSEPGLFQTQDGLIAYRIVKVDSKVPPHVANIKQDYSKIQQAAKNQKEVELLSEWVKKRAKRSYVYISPDYANCVNLESWMTDTKKP